MSGGLFDKMRIVAGRRHDDRARGAAVVRANSASYGLTVAEVLAGVVHRAVETGHVHDLLGAAREQWGITREDPFPYSGSQVEAARGPLSDIDRRWSVLAAGEHLKLAWTVAVT